VGITVAERQFLIFTEFRNVYIQICNVVIIVLFWIIENKALDFFYKKTINIYTSDHVNNYANHLKGFTIINILYSESIIKLFHERVLFWRQE